jgi:hypothetical protein
MKKTISFPAVFFGAFISPRQTTQEVIKDKYYSFIIPFVIFYSLVAALNPMLSFMLTKYMVFPEAYCMTFFLMFGLGFVCYFFGSWLTHWMGSKFEGKGTLQEVRAAYVLAYVPMLVGGLLKILLDLPGQLTLISTTANLGDINALDFVKTTNPLSGLLAFIFIIWSMVTWVVALSEANQYSIGKAIKTSLAMMALWIGIFIVLVIAVVLIGVVIALAVGKAIH